MRSDKRSKPAGSVGEYIAAAPKDVRKILRELRRTIKAAAPEAEERISYQVPAYNFKGPVVFFAVFRNHMSLFVPGDTLRRFRSKLEPFAVKGASIHFTVENPIPSSLVKEIVRARIKENESRAKETKKSCHGCP